MAENGKQLTPRQQKAIAALMAAQSIRDAASAAGTPERTLYRWLKEDASFRATLREAQNEVLNTATRSLLLFAQPAVYALAGAMTDELARPSERARAASALLSHLVALREHTDHDDRLLTLEKKAHDKKR